MALPEPDAAQRALSHALREYIARAIDQAGGAISFAEYMHFALYTPGLGYYAAGQRKFGPAGDFVTAPELSPLFSRALARQCAEVLAGEPDSVLLELGPGGGRMAAEILRALQEWDCLPREYLLLEPSPDLQQRQHAILAETVPDLLPRARWLERLEDETWPRGVILANEVLDALPVHRFVIRDGAVRELGVTQGDAGFTWAEMPPTPALARVAPELAETCPEGYVSEVCPALEPWLADLARVGEQTLALLVDYGFPRDTYYHPQRNQGTLMCHYRHHAHGDPFFWPGLQDLTAHVDFTRAAWAAHHAGWTVSGFTSQADFLLALDILDDLPESEPATGMNYWAEASAVKQLLMPHEMGELFQVLALTKGQDLPLRGFARNRLERL